jgi:hypothetical protein
VLASRPAQAYSLVTPGPERGEEEGLVVINADASELDVLVRRVVSPLDTGSLHGRGHGALQRDPGVEVTFLLDQADFLRLRQRLLERDGEVSFSVSSNDVTAIDTAPDRLPAALV